LDVLEFYTDQLSQNNDVMKAPEEPRHPQNNIPIKSMQSQNKYVNGNPVSIFFLNIKSIFLKKKEKYNY